MPYTLKFWLRDYHRPLTRKGLSWRLAYRLATKSGYAKAQVINEKFGTIELEYKPGLLRSAPATYSIPQPPPGFDYREPSPAEDKEFLDRKDRQCLIDDGIKF